jgi:ribose 5-phosphate isomerase
MEIIENSEELDINLKKHPGVVETGLFYNSTDLVLAGVGDEVKEIYKKKREQT